ncbi:hypothetical protein E2C01_023106 [Portunus trituberculatus]|uniref:Uncharacterized protein n=1 Tax=Portunus trituberculatus TaxID=210409 RepID=A0A5B7E934_PORTR|nr:hypothetical protein [Portunus trituberculatus]
MLLSSPLKHTKSELSTVKKHRNTQPQEGGGDNYNEYFLVLLSAYLESLKEVSAADGRKGMLHLWGAGSQMSSVLFCQVHGGPHGTLPCITALTHWQTQAGGCDTTITQSNNMSSEKMWDCRINSSKSESDAVFLSQGLGGVVPREWTKQPSLRRYPRRRLITAIRMFFRHCWDQHTHG